MNSIDCLIVGYNELSITKTAESLRKNSIDCKRLSLDFIRKDKKIYSVADIFNKIIIDNNIDITPLNWSEVLTAVVPYLKSFLTKKGIITRYINDFKREKESLAEILSKNKVSTLVITTALYPTLTPIIEIISFVKQISANTKIIVGGPFIYNCINTLKEKDLNNLLSIINADYYVSSMEGESTLANLVYSIKNGRADTDIPNVYSKKINAFECSCIKGENNLIEDNLVDWSLLREAKSNYYSVRLSTSCPFNCSFCSFSNQQFRYLKTNEVEENLKLLFNSCGNRNVHFVDDAFNVPAKRFKEFLYMLDRNKFNVKWTGLLRLQFLDEEIAELMQKTGCQSILLGIESGSQKILSLMNKKVKIEQYIDGIALLNKYNITSKASFLVGFPGETNETIKETYDFIESSKPTFYYINLWYNDVLSPIYQRKDEFNIQGKGFEWSHNTMNHQQAMKHIEEILMSVKNSIWLPLFNMDYLLPAHLLNKGLSISEVKNFIATFSDGVKEIIHDNQEAEVSDEIMNRLRKIVLSSNLAIKKPIEC